MSKKTIFFDDYCGYQISVIVENGKITEFDFEKRNNTSVIGNIYKGRVEKILPGMNSAFVNCGLERNCYLSADDVPLDKSRYDGGGENPVFPDIKEGGEIAVQVIKAPVGNKGARVAAHFSFVGKHMIYMPDTPFVGVSRKITDAELRKNLIYCAETLKSRDEGVVMRTSAPYANHVSLENEIKYLRNLYSGVAEELKKARVGALLYTDLELPMRVMRDTLSYDIERIIVGSQKLASLIRELVNLYPAEYRRPVLLHDSGRDMLEEYGLSEQISALTSPRVNLENGAYLVIEKTEALTVIDVNTGGFTGADSLEQTVYSTNISAAREIARQVKLRNIGGIVVVDFIDMSDPRHCDSIVSELEKALKKDIAKCTVGKMSEFGLVEFTRKRTGGNPLALMTKPCRHCRGGKIKTARYALLEMRSALLKFVADGHRFIRADMHATLFEKLNEWQELKADLAPLLQGAEVYLVPRRSYTEEQISYRLDGALPENAVKFM